MTQHTQKGDFDQFPFSIKKSHTQQKHSLWRMCNISISSHGQNRHCGWPLMDCRSNCMKFFGVLRHHRKSSACLLRSPLIPWWRYANSPICGFRGSMKDTVQTRALASKFSHSGNGCGSNSTASANPSKDFRPQYGDRFSNVEKWYRNDGRRRMVHRNK